MSMERPSRSEVMAWSPQQLAEYLRRVRPRLYFLFLLFGYFWLQKSDTAVILEGGGVKDSLCFLVTELLVQMGFTFLHNNNTSSTAQRDV